MSGIRLAGCSCHVFNNPHLSKDLLKLYLLMVPHNRPNDKKIPIELAKRLMGLK